MLPSASQTRPPGPKATVNAEKTGSKVIALRMVPEKRKVATADAYAPLLAGIVALLQESRRAAGRTINSILTSAYSEIGRRIAVEEQRGRRKANYGEQLVEQLATDLTARFGKGFSRRQRLSDATVLPSIS